MPMKPIRIFDGPHEPHEPFWCVKNTADEPEIELYGFISEYSWFDDEITPAKFKDDLTKAGNGGPVTLRIHSPGGDVFAASVMRSILVEYPGRVTVRVDGMAASAATIVASAGDIVKMQDTAFWMIHDPIALAWGNVEELKAIIDSLKSVKDGILDAYEARSKVGREKLAKWMSDETWFSAGEALDAGFIDEVIGGKSTPASTMQGAAIMNALANYRHVPATLLQATTPPQTEVAKPVNNVAAERLRAEIKLIV